MWMNSILGCTTLAQRLQILLSARRSRTFATPFLTFHVFWHPLSYDPHLPLQFPPYSPIPPQAGPTVPVATALRQSPGTSLPKLLALLLVVRMPMLSMVELARLTRLLLPKLLSVQAKAKAQDLSPLPLLLKSRRH